VFVVGEIALAFTLLTASIILIVHLRNLDRVDLGFEPNGLLTFDLVLPQRVLGSEARWPEQQRLMAALQQTPGVTSATFANQLPTFPGCIVGSVYVEGRPPAAETRQMCLTMTTADFFPTMRIPLRAGRLLNAARHGAAPTDSPKSCSNESKSRSRYNNECRARATRCDQTIPVLSDRMAGTRSDRCFERLPRQAAPPVSNTFQRG
jgi:hypothetical protein